MKEADLRAYDMLTDSSVIAPGSCGFRGLSWTLPLHEEIGIDGVLQIIVEEGHGQDEAADLLRHAIIAREGVWVEGAQTGKRGR